jgi:hypothetical protein
MNQISDPIAPALGDEKKLVICQQQDGKSIRFAGNLRNVPGWDQ